MMVQLTRTCKRLAQIASLSVFLVFFKIINTAVGL